MPKPPIFIRRPREWRNLHPAPSHLVEERNCCDCIFHNSLAGRCKLHDKEVNNYDECGAFTRAPKQEQPTPQEKE